MVFDPNKVYERILNFGDIHEPFAHVDAMDFLADMNRIYKPDLVVNLGDLIDFHASSFHDNEQESSGPDREFLLARKRIQNGVCRIFNSFTSVLSNHTDMPNRKAKVAKITQHYIKSHADALEINPKRYTWHPEIIVQTPKGPVLYCHGRGSNIVNNAKEEGMSMVQGHYHERFGMEYFGGDKMLFGLQNGCLIDNDKYAFRYNKTNKKKPLIGASVIIEGCPILEPMS